MSHPQHNDNYGVDPSAYGLEPPDIVVSQGYVYNSHYTLYTCKLQPRTSGPQRVSGQQTMHPPTTSISWRLSFDLQVS